MCLIMTTLFNRLFNSLYAFLPWKQNSHKRLRDDSSEENEENFHAAVTSPKKQKLQIAPFGQKILNEMNLPTVTTVKASFKPSSASKLQIGDCGKPPKHVSSPIKLRRRFTASTPITSIDLTKNGDSRSCGECQNISTIDLTNSVPENQTRGQSHYPVKRLSSVVDLTGDDMSSIKTNKVALGRPNGLSRRKSLELMRRKKGTPIVSIDLTSTDFDKPSGQIIKRKQIIAEASNTSPVAVIDLEERNTYGRVLGSMLEGKLPTSPTHKSPIKAGTLVDLTSDDEDSKEISRKTLSPQSNRKPPVKYIMTSPVIEIKDDASRTSSFSKSGTKLNISKVNSFEAKLKDVPFTHQEWVMNLMKEYKETQKSFVETRDRFFHEATAWNDENRKVVEELLEKKLERHLKITEALITETPEDEFAPIIVPMPPFSKAVEEKIKAALVRNPENETLIDKFNLKITRRDIQTLNDLNWLNDEVINFYMQLLEERAITDERFPSLHTFSTFFYAGLQSRGHAGMKRWTKKVNIFEKQLVIIPIHLHVHWCLVVIDLKKKELNYYDSMGHDNNKCLKHMSNYLIAEHVAKQGSPLDMSDWRVQNVKNIPQQMNGSDCGIFACTYAEYSSRRAPFNFDQSRMQYFRRKMVYEIISGRLM